MRKVLLIILGALLVGALLSMAISYDTGYIRISFGHYLLETNFWVGLALFLFAMLLLHWVLRLITRLRQGGGGVTQWISRSSQRRARRRTTKGLIEFSEGNWPRARKLLTSSADQADTPLINYLAAAEAAHEEDDQQAAEELLRKAYESTPGSDLAVGLTQARLQLSAGRYEQALATLLRLRKQAPKHPFVLKLLKSAYTALEDWRELSQLLPELRKQKIMSDEEIKPLEQQCWLNLLQQAADQVRRQSGSSRSMEELDRVWDGLPGSMRRDETVIHAYAKHLADLGAENQAETVLRKVLRNHWSDLLINLYGRVASAKPDEQLLTAERWLKERPNNTELLLALGRLSLRNELWGKAREYFETSLRLQRKDETLAELCRLTAHLGDNEQSVRLLKQGLLDGRGLPDLPMPS
ncbi:heme biosynthesis HemY N-terminal domain-containing protein [Marinobacteraceae bacterium S3BR75-40.1]